MTEEEKPRFVLAAEELALQRGEQGETWKTVLAGDRERSSNSSYPGPDCLLPDDLERIFAGGARLDTAQADHVATCRGCAALLASAAADPGELQLILERVRAAAPATPGEPTGPPSRVSEALGKTARLGSLVLAAGVVTAFAAKHLRQR